MAKSRQTLSVRAQLGIVVANVVVILGILGVAVAAPRSPFVAVVVAPWSAPEEAVKVVAAAQGSLVAPGRFGWIVIAHSLDGEFASRLRHAGAWFVLDHKTLSGCFQR